MPYDAPDLARMSLADIAALSEGRKLPPVGDWHPEASRDSEMIIAADGRWYHQGGVIRRKAMVRAFSSLLRREHDGRYALVLPYEKQFIAVEDAPFQAVEMKCEDDGERAQLLFRLDSDDVVVAGPDHPLRTGESAAEPRIYLHVRGGLEARLSRSVYYELAELALATDPARPGIWSGGAFFALGEDA